MSRKNFIKTSSALLAGGSTLLATGSIAKEQESLAGAVKNFTLKNVRLETGFEYDEREVVATKSDLFTIEISDGKVKTIAPNKPSTKGIDAKGWLMLPAFKDMHIHLDKTYYGGPWKARLKKNRSVRDMIAHEQKIIPELLKTSTFRAEKLIELLQYKGSHFARSHVNIDPTSRLESLKNLQQALENKKNSFGAELVIFPQHGLYYTDARQLMKEAATMNVDFIGGLDPNAIDGDMKRSMDFTIQLALDNNKGIDIHLHEGGEAGLQTVEYLVEKVNENPVLKNKTYLSHCFVLASLEASKMEAIAAKLAEAKIGIVSTIPFGRTIMPIPTLYKHGVEVLTGNDSIIDHWSTFGSGSVLQKASLMAQLYGYSTEFDLSRSLKLATGNVLPLDDKGNRQWPTVGSNANMVLAEASCSAEAVARIAPVKSLIHEGNIVF